MELTMRYLLIVLAFLGGCAQADDTKATDHSALKSRLATAFPGMTVTAVEPSPVAGLLEVQLNGNEWLYTSEDGEYLLSGELYQIQPEGGLVNLAEQKLAVVRKAGIKDIDPKDMITYAANKEKAEVYVFTDTSCGYCRKMHQHIAEYNALGISVHYLAFPRGGMKNPAADTMRAVWCSSDRQSALNEAKLNNMQATPPPSCKDPVAAEYQLGIDFGVRGTPAIYTVEGENIGGYLPPAEMAKSLGLVAPRS